VKTATQQQMMAAKRKALGLSLLARTMLASLRTETMNAFNRIIETGSKGYRPIASIQAVDLCTAFSAPIHQHETSPASFYGCNWTHARNIRGGNP
jgi:hypothetical protein